jgi:hypothetical protein
MPETQRQSVRLCHVAGRPDQTDALQICPTAGNPDIVLETMRSKALAVDCQAPRSCFRQQHEPHGTAEISAQPQLKTTPAVPCRLPLSARHRPDPLHLDCIFLISSQTGHQTCCVTASAPSCFHVVPSPKETSLHLQRSLLVRRLWRGVQPTCRLSYLSLCSVLSSYSEDAPA